MRNVLSLVLTVAMVVGAQFAAAGEPMMVDLSSNAVGTLHVQAKLGGHVDTEFLLDTGSAFVVLSEATRRTLSEEGALVPLRRLRAVLANNAVTNAQVYRVASLELASGCVVRDFEAVVLPGARKNILGLSALRSVAPFTVHLEPLRLELNCVETPAAASVVALVN